MKGNNPFDKFTDKPKEDPPDTPDSSTPGVGEMWKRMQEAQVTAAKQREYTKQAIRDNRKTQDVPDLPPETVEVRVAKPIKWDGHTVWNALWVIIWLRLSLAMISADIVGGLVLTIPATFACVILSCIPKWLGSGGFISSGRGPTSGAI